MSIHRRADASQPFRPAPCYQPQLLLAHFGMKRLSHKIHLRQHRGSRLQHRTLSDIKSGVNVSVHELTAFLAAACTQDREDS